MMLSNEIREIENQNCALKKALEELSKKMEKNSVVKPRSCQYCKYYIQHYAKNLPGSISQFTPVHAGHCVVGAPTKNGGKRRPNPDDSCPYFELGTYDTRNYY